MTTLVGSSPDSQNVNIHVTHGPFMRVTPNVLCILTTDSESCVDMLLCTGGALLARKVFVGVSVQFTVEAHEM